MSRMSESLSVRENTSEYLLELQILCRYTRTKQSEWQLLIDNYQISTRAAGKSGCAYFFKQFKNLSEAALFLESFHLVRPDVNCELHVNPDGRFDRGDGIASYFHAEWEQLRGGYVPQKGKSYTILIDVQNLGRKV